MSEAFTEAGHDVVQMTSTSMPAAKHRIALTVRVNPEQYKAWSDSAAEEALPLSTWIARVCNVASKAAGHPVAVSTRKRRPRTTGGK